MDKKRILEIQALAEEIDNFKNCYSGIELWGEAETFVQPETLLAFLIENPHFQDIANKISALS